MYEQYLIRLLAPLSLYDLRAPHNGGELAALGGELDSVSGLVELVERESLLATAESEGLDRREGIVCSQACGRDPRGPPGRPSPRCCGSARTA